MRNLKKVLTLVLTVAMLLSIMVVGTGAAFSDQESIKNKEAVDVCTTLNIIAGMEDGSYRPANNVTRAQMCKMICVALNGGKEPTLGTNATPTFSDVRTDPSSSWAESFIESCNSQGIVSGVGGGRFSPSGSVTGTQAARMLLVALGYRADQQGFTGDSWAINVNTLASAKGLYAGIESIDANAALSRDNAAQMIWNALNAYEVEYISQLVTDANGNLTSKLTAQDRVVGNTKDKITLLEDKYEADTAVGTFNGDSNVVGTLDKGNIQIINAKINGETLKDANDKAINEFEFKYDLSLQYLGEEIKVLYRDNNDGANGRLDPKDTIYGVYVTGATTVYNITKNDLQTPKGSDTDIIRFGDKDYKVVGADENFVFIDKNYGADTSNKGAVGGTTAASVATAIKDLKSTSADSIKLICDNSGKIMKAYVVEYKLARVTAVNSDSVSLNSSIGTIKIADNNIYSGVAKDDIVVATTLYNVSATSSDAYTTIEKAAIVEGKLTAYNGVKSVSVDGTSYDVYRDDITTNKAVSSDLIKNATDLDGQIGETIRVYLIGGIVYAAEMVTEASQYAVVEDATGSVGSTFDPLKAKIMKSDGTEATVEIHKDSVAAAKVMNGVDIDGAGPGTETGKLGTGAVIKYSDVSDSKIKISEISGATTSTPAIPKIYNKDNKEFNTTITATDGVLFVNRNGDFYVYNIRNLRDVDLAANGVYSSMTSDNKVVAAYVTLGTRPTADSANAVYGIVSSENGTIKVGNDTYTSYTVQVDDVRDNDKTVLIEGAGDTTLKEGDLVFFNATADNVYGTSDVKVYARLTSTTVGGTTTTSVTTSHSAKVVYVNEYEEGSLLSYFTNVTGSGPYTGDSYTLENKAVDKNVKVVYVDSDDNEAVAIGSINEFDAVTGKQNAVVVFEDDTNTKSIVAIYVDVDNNIAR